MVMIENRKNRHKWGKKKKRNTTTDPSPLKTTAMNILVNFRFYSFFMSKCLFKKTLITMKGM